jgi:hypothetical protein
MTVNLWSQTAATNATADATINWREGQAASTVNNSARAMMAAIAKKRDDDSGNIVTTGSSTAYAITTNQSLTPLVDGYTVTARIHTTNGAAPTLNVDSTGAIAIRVATSTAIPASAMLGGSVQRFTYDSSDACWYANSYISAPATGDLGAIEALTGTGIARRTGSDTWAVASDVTHLADTTANRLFGTNGSGVSGLITLSAPLTLSGAALSVDAASDTAAGKIEIATQAEQVTATDVLRASTPGRQMHHPCHAKAFATFSQSGAHSLVSSFGITSIADDGGGQSKFTFSTAFASASGYGVVMSADQISSDAAGMFGYQAGGAKTTTVIDVFLSGFNGGDVSVVDHLDAIMVAFGAQ